MIFKLSIELGNEAMQTGGDVAGALENVATKLRREHEYAKVDYGDRGGIRDLNGNTVGTWKVDE